MPYPATTERTGKAGGLHILGTEAQLKTELPTICIAASINPSRTFLGSINPSQEQLSRERTHSTYIGYPPIL
jgi:hypothetical protein